MKAEEKHGLCTFNCPIEVTVTIVGGKWKAGILFHLLDGKKRFGEIKKTMSGVSQRILTLQLRELEADKILTRTVFPEVPPRVEYELTNFGLSLKPILMEMMKWGDRYSRQVTKIKNNQ